MGKLMPAAKEGPAANQHKCLMEAANTKTLLVCLDDCWAPEVGVRVPV